MVLPLLPALSVALALNLVYRLAQCADRRSRHGNAPVAGAVGGGAVRQPFNITVTVVPAAGLETPLMIRSRFFGIVNDVIAGDGVDGQRRAAEINSHIVSRAVAVARRDRSGWR